MCHVCTSLHRGEVHWNEGEPVAGLGLTDALGKEWNMDSTWVCTYLPTTVCLLAAAAKSCTDKSGTEKWTELKVLFCLLPQSQQCFVSLFFLLWSRSGFVCCDHHGPPWNTKDMYTSNREPVQFIRYWWVKKKAWKPSGEPFKISLFHSSCSFAFYNTFQ